MTDTDRTTDETRISPALSRAAIMVEKYVLPWIYAFLGYRRLSTLVIRYLTYRAEWAAPGHQLVSGPLFFASLTKDLLLFVIMSFMAVLLLFSRAPARLPEKLKHLIVPLAMSFYFLLYGALDKFPISWRENLIPAGWQVPCAVSALVLSLIGHAIAIWALVHLGRSFAVLVEVREVVFGGPYRYVRHPIYLGYTIELAGLLLSNLSVAMLLLGAIFLLLLVARARIEEEKLSESSEEYRRYASRTGFLFPGVK